MTINCAIEKIVRHGCLEQVEVVKFLEDFLSKFGMTIFLLEYWDGSLVEFMRNVTPRSIRTGKFSQNVEFVCDEKSYKIKDSHGKSYKVPKSRPTSYQAYLTKMASDKAGFENFKDMINRKLRNEINLEKV